MRNGRTHMTPPTRLAAIALASGLILGACGGGGGGSDGAGTTTVSGTAATGAPMAGAAISARCRDGWNDQVSAGDDGRWTLSVPAAKLPCALRATPAGTGDSHYGFTIGDGSSITANITPLTSLTLANTGSVPDATWFTGLDNAGLDTLAGQLAQALTNLRDALRTAGYRYDGAELPAGFDPITTRFLAEAGNAYDDLLETLKAALAGQDFATLLQTVADGGTLPDAPDDETPPASCAAGDDKLTFTGGPADFCGFTRHASANTITNYYQFTASAGDNGIAYVKFTLASDGGNVSSMVIENDKYAFGCGTSTACTGITLKQVNGHTGFVLKDTVLAAISGASQGITVNGLLIHPTATTPDDGISGPLSAPASATYSELFSNLAGSYKLKVTAASAGGENVFSTGDMITLKIQNASPPLTLTFTDRSSQTERTMRFDSNTNFHVEGSGNARTDILRIENALGQRALNLRYQPSSGHLTVYFSGFYGATNEGLATFETRQD